ncbi:hypothetical protein EI94DRAFT_1719361, partial [Lactarius quietus]
MLSAFEARAERVRLSLLEIYFARFSRALLLPNFQIMAGQKAKTTSKKSDLEPSRGRSLKGGTKEALSQSAEAIEHALS